MISLPVHDEFGRWRLPMRPKIRRPRRRQIPSRAWQRRFDVVSEPATDEPVPDGGERLRWIQSTLNHILGIRLSVDGVMSRETRSAIRSFQERQELPADGFVGLDTERALIAARGARPPESQPPEAGELEWRPVSLFPAKPAGSAGSPSNLPVPLFLPKPADPLTADPKMERALEKTRRLRPGAFPIRFTFVDVTRASGSFPSAGYLETETDYIASEAKVAVTYSVYALRDIVQRFAAASGANPANLFARLASQMDPSIVKASRNIALSLLMDTHRLDTGTCARGVGYGHSKLGLGLLKSGQEGRSEVSVYQSPVAKGRRYVVAWQNLVGSWPDGVADIAKIIKATIAEYES